MGPFVITPCFTKGTVTLQCGAIQITYNIRRIKPYKSDTKVDDSNVINMYDAFNIRITSHILLSYFKARKKYMIGYTRKHLMIINILRVREVFHEDVILFTTDCDFRIGDALGKGS